MARPSRPEPLPSLDTEEGFARTASGSAARRRAAVGGVVAGGVRRPRRRLHPLADLRGGVLPRRRARPGEPERHLPARPRPWRSAPTSRRRASCRRWRERGACGRRRWSEPNAGSDLAALRSAATRDGRPGGCSTDRRSGLPRRSGPTGASASSAPTPRRSATAASPSCSPLDSPGVTVRPIAQLDGDTGFAEIFFDDVHVPVENTLGEVNQGWRVAMATAGFERGVSLRSPAASAPPPTASSSCGRRDAEPADARATRSSDAWMQAEGYQLHTYMTVTHCIDGRHASAPRPASTRSSGARWTCASTSPPSTCSGPRPSGWTVASGGSTGSCSRCRARSTRAPTRSSATSSPNQALGLPR